MKRLEDLQKDITLINSVDWDLDPAVAVGRHLEWGAGWADDKYRARGSSDQSIYFTISTWESPPVVVLVKRDGFEREEVASFRLPQAMEEEFLKSVGYHKGVYGIDGKIKAWIKKKLNAE